MQALTLPRDCTPFWHTSPAACSEVSLASLHSLKPSSLRFASILSSSWTHPAPRPAHTVSPILSIVVPDARTTLSLPAYPIVGAHIDTDAAPVHDVSAIRSMYARAHHVPPPPPPPASRGCTHDPPLIRGSRLSACHTARLPSYVMLCELR